MKAQNLRLFTLAVLALSIGCRSSKSAAPAPQPSPQAVATPAQNLTAPPPANSQSADPPSLKSFRISPPASFSIGMLPENGPAVFTGQGRTGQYLWVRVQEDEVRNAHPLGTSALSAEALGTGSNLESLVPEYCAYEAMYALPADGAFRVMLNPAGHKLGLDFALLDSNDPVLSAGISPEQISIDFGGLGQAGSFKAVPYDHVCEIGESWPASLVMQSNRFWLRIAQVEGYKKAFPKDGAMQLLISRLQPGAKPPDAKNLPYPNSGGDAATVMTARPELITGEGWKAWRWVEGSSQDGDYPGGVSYIAEGVSDDRRLFFRITGRLDHPDVKRWLPRAGGDRTQDETNSRLRLEKALAAADPASFQPNLDQLDAVIRSLKIPH